MYYTMVIVITAFGFAFWQPLASLALSPILLGAAHIASDITYLALPRWSQKKALWILAGLLAFTGYITETPFFYLLPLLLIPWFYKAPITKTFYLSSLVFLAGHLLFTFKTETLLVLVYLHNLIGIFIWLLWSPKNRSIKMTVGLGLLGVLSLAILIGAFDKLILMPNQQLSISGKSLQDLAFSLTWTSNEILALRWLMLFIFWQLFHYGIWLVLLPLSHHESIRTLCKKYTAYKLIIVGSIVATIYFCLLAKSDIWGARSLYLNVGAFHVYLEIFFLFILFCEKNKETSC